MSELDWAARPTLTSGAPGPFSAKEVDGVMSWEQERLACLGTGLSLSTRELGTCDSHLPSGPHLSAIETCTLWPLWGTRRKAQTRQPDFCRAEIPISPTLQAKGPAAAQISTCLTLGVLGLPETSRPSRSCEL